MLGAISTALIALIKLIKIVISYSGIIRKIFLENKLKDALSTLTKTNLRKILSINVTVNLFVLLFFMIVISGTLIYMINVKTSSKIQDYKNSALISEVEKMRSIVNEMRVENTKQSKMLIEKEINAKENND